MEEKKSKKIKDLTGPGLKSFNAGGNRVRPGNDFIPFNKEEIQQSIPARFEAIVEKYPDKIAVKTGGGSVTYNVLDKQSNRVAQSILAAYDDRFALNENEKKRYSRQLKLHGWGIEAQEKLKSAAVFVAGAGGSGSPLIQQLALCGVGTIIVCDYDTVELSNLNRQVLHDESRIGMNKALSAQMTVNRVNPYVKVIAHTEKITADNVYRLVGDASIIFDNVDDIETKFILSQCAIHNNIPHILSSMIDMDAYAAILHPPHGPCFHCLYDKDIINEIEEIRKIRDKGDKDYETFSNPVASPALFLSAGFAVNEALKIILGLGTPSYNKFFLFDQRGVKNIIDTLGYKQITYPFSRHFKESCKKQGFDWDEGLLDDKEGMVKELTVAPDPQCPLCKENGHGQERTAVEKRPVPVAEVAEEKPQRAAALLFEHGIDMITGIMGVLKTGMLYVPLDASYPEDRLSYILEDSDARVIVTNHENIPLAETLRNNVNKNIAIININEILADVSMQNVSMYNSAIAIDPGQLAYILYTSGSTGKPKGVMQNHHNILHHARVYTNALHIHAGDKLTLFSSYSFDAAKMDIYGALLNGAVLYPYNIKQENHLLQLPSWLRAEGITIYHSIPTVYRYFTGLLEGMETGGFPRLRMIVLGGEAVYKKDVDNYKKYFPAHCLFVNGLGPTESTVTLQYFIDNKTGITREAVPVGYPVEDTEVLLLTGNNQEAGVLGVGEIVFKSEHLALGYWKNPELTAEKFCLDKSFSGGAGGRLYKTGDLGRRLPDGAVEFVGRSDFQVKISGYRVEPGEIESKLDRTVGIKKSVVVCKTGNNGENFLAAYYTATGEKEINENDLVSILKERLPDYMIPAVFISLPELPLTTTGKIDRKLLTDHDFSHLLRRDEIEAPGSETETRLLKLWQEVLKQDTVGVNENFFLLGGNSIKAILLVSLIYRELEVKISLVEIFKHPTIKALAKYVENSKKCIYEAITPVEKKEYYPLSSSQRRLFFLSRFEDVGTGFNIPIGLKINGVLDKERYEIIFGKLMTRHETLRTSFHLLDGQPVQKIHETSEFEIEIIGIDNGNPAWSALIMNFIRPFDLSKAPLFRVGIISLSDEEHYLLFDTHHIIFDGVSTVVLVEDFKRLYEGKESKPLKIQYKDFAVWQNYLFETGGITAAEAYWLNLYSDAAAGQLSRLELPLDYPRTAVMNYEGESYRFILNNEESGALKEMAFNAGVSLYMTLLAIYSIFLAKLARQDDIIAATITSGRNHADTGQVIGAFINMLTMRNYPAGDKKFTDFLNEVRTSTLDAFENQDYPFETLVEKLAIGRDIVRHPLTDAGFTLQDLDVAANRNELDNGSLESQLKLTSLKTYRKTAREDLNLEAFEIRDHLEFEFQYRTKLFKNQTIVRFAGYFKTLVSRILENPSQRIRDIDSLTAEEKELLLSRFNQTEQIYPGNKTVTDLFEDQVRRTPENIAVRSTIELKNIYDRLKPEVVIIELTYKELDEKANHLAHELREKGIQVNDMVGLMARHPLELAAAILGILKAGGAYLPIDPSYPFEIKKYILEDSRVPLIVTEEIFADDIQSLLPSSHVILMDDPGADQSFSTNQTAAPGVPDIAYVIYTSGTTGRPKGVPVPHDGIVNYALWRIEFYGYSEKDVTLQPLSYSFDGFGSNFYSSLLSGGILFVVPEEKRMDGEYLAAVIAANRVTNVSLVPGMYRLLLDSMDEGSLQSIRFVALAGENSGEALVKKSRMKAPFITLINEYGPTEITVTAACRMPMDEANTAIIGNPISNKQIYILDRCFKPVPIGFPGELLVSGTGIARGYLNNPELTAEKFRPQITLITLINGVKKTKINKSFAGVKGGLFQKPPLVIYKTGDLARWLENGDIEFLGRIDHQVKIRGYRVEPAEIETQLLKHENVKEAAVTVSGDNDNKYICAYITPHSPELFTAGSIKDYLAERLTHYMTPSRFVILENIPLTPAGKVDYKKLPLPEAVYMKDSHTAPTSELEKKLAEIWEEVLAIEKDKIGIHTNFFEIGGHSLKATQLISRIHKTLDIKIPQTEIFKSPTIDGLARYITGSGQSLKNIFQAIPPVEKKEYYPLSSAQLRMFILQQMKPGSTAYNMPFAHALGNEPDTERLEDTFQKLIRRHESLRTSFPTINGTPVQRIHENVEEKNLIKALRPEAIKSFIQPFDLAKTPLIRAALLKIEETKHVLIVDMHHIISDGISHHVLVKDFIALYSGKELPPLKLHYKEYALWRNETSQTETLIKQERYWLEQFKGNIPVLQMPLDFKRPPKQSFEGQTITFTIPGAVTEALRTLAIEQDVSLNILIIALYTLLLNKYTGQPDIIVGSLAAGRNHPDLEKIIGMFANFLPIRNRVEPDYTFSEFLQGVKKNTLDAYNNQDYPFEKMIDQLEVPVDLSRNAIFDTMVVFHNQIDFSRDENPGDLQLDFTPYKISNQISTLDFKLDVSLASPRTLECRMQYDTRLFKEESINRFIRHFQNLAAAVVETPQRKISEIELFTAADKAELEEKVQLVLCSTFTIEPAAEYIKWWGARFNLGIDATIAPYNQVFQELLDENSLLSTNRGINVLLIRFEDWIRDIVASYSHEAICEKLEKDFNRLNEIFNAAPKAGPYLVGIFPVSTHLSLSQALITYLEEMNNRWQEAAASAPNVYVIDLASLAELYQIEEIFDPVADRGGHLPFSAAYYAALGTDIARAVCALNQHLFKVIALDCDNTLWKGICGEDGANGVQIEGPYLELQQFMLQKYNQGMLLTLCSKNNEPDVWEVFEKKTGMLLKKEHFVDWAIDWNPKSANLAALASRLNLGIDSFIMVDDSPAECSEIMTRRPEVLTLQLPADPAYIPRFLKHVWAFDKLKITGEDRQRSRMYLDDRERRESLGKSISLDDFLAGLELKVAMNRMNPSQVSRVSQLTQRTNQFNLSTRRRTEEEIETLTRRIDTQCWAIEVSDRFGAYGLAGVVITREQSNELFIDTFLLSCRVLGRRVEEAILVGMRHFCRERGLRALRADYYPTPKNKPILTFLETRWEKGPQNHACATYTLIVEQIPESVEHVNFYYLRTFEKELPKVPEVPDSPPFTLSHPSAGSASHPTMNTGPTGMLEKNSPIKENPWEINIVNSEHLLYRHHLLPLENCTAEKLLRLPLPQNPEDRRRGRTKSENAYEPPRNDVESKLVDIWSQLLGIPTEVIGITAGFFELGGSSLGVIKLLSEINRAFAIEVPMERLFINVKIKEIAKYILDLKEKHEGIPGGPAWETPVMLLNDPGSRPIFLFPPIVGYGIGYRALAKHIDNSSLYAFNYIATEDRLKKYAAHIAGIRQKGPLVLGGYSAGGNLAFEVAKELEEQGYEVAAVIMMDSFPKDSRFSQETADENHSFREAVNEAMGNFGLDFLKEEVVGKLNHYAHYFNHLENRGKVNADIYFIIAEETGKPAYRSFVGWEEYTRKTCHMFQGFGKHVDMFNPHYVEKNARVIKVILEQVWKCVVWNEWED